MILHVNMRTISVVWACLAANGHGDRVQQMVEPVTVTDKKLRSLYTAAGRALRYETSCQEGHQKCNSLPLRALALLLFSLDLPGFQVAFAGKLPLRCRRALTASVMRRCSQTSVHASAGEFDERRAALKQCLHREYTSFFRPFEQDFYSEAVTFEDPLNKLDGRDSYKGNVEMLSGESLIGNFLFSDGFIDLHAVEDVPGDVTRLRTRWTLGFTFKLLPWKPKALFTGISEYGIHPSSALVLSQRDYWDTLSLQGGGSYAPEAALSGLADLVGQLMPEALRPAAAQEPAAAADAKWSLLRRAKAYRIYRGDDGAVFALVAPGYESGLEGVERELQLHGVGVGARMQVSGVQAVRVETPHPWE